MSAPMCRFCSVNRQNLFSYYGKHARAIQIKTIFRNVSMARYHSVIQCNIIKVKNGSNFVYKSATGRLSTLVHVRNVSTEDTATKLSSSQSPIVLGIETSCDDTGAAVVNSNGHILGDSLNSQTKYHIKFGGILPKVAKNLHQQNIHSVVQDALNKSQCSINDVDAIATTVKPGFTMSLNVGLEYAKTLVEQSGKPFIPIHHMEAHALTARMVDSSIEFPFLTLLLSGGHCLLAVVRDVDDFILIGKGQDDAPGDAFDKIARRLRLRNLPEFSEMSGGQAIETLAQCGNPLRFDLVSVMARTLDCNFSFSGLKTAMIAIIDKEEKDQGISVTGILPNLSDICASFQYFILHHIAKRLQRGFLFCELHGLLPPQNRCLAVSGGVASNQFIRSGLEHVCAEYDCRLVCPPPQLCTDNGIMIAWNGVEKMRQGLGITEDVDSVVVQNKCPLGEDWTARVSQANLSKLPRIKLLS